MRRIIAMLMAMSIVFMLGSCSVRPLNGDDEPLYTNPVTDGSIDTEIKNPETDAPETDPVPDKTEKISFIGCGDNIIYYGTYRDAKAQAVAGGREYNFRPMYSNVESIIKGADLAFINQETVISHSFPPESYPGFNSPVDLADDLVDVGFDIICVANNHMLDKGALGLKDTYYNWKERPVTLIGCHEENDSGKYVTYVEKNGIKIGLVAYTYGTNLGEDPAKYGLYASYLKYADIEGELEEARANADFVIVSVHWGEEGHNAPGEEQKTYAKRFADGGADVIIGHHPHTLQPIEWIDGQNGHKTLCVYSLGNFLHEQEYEFQIPGGMISFDIVKINDNDATCENVKFIPTVCHYPSNFYNNKIYLLKDYTEELANAHAVNTYYKHKMTLGGIKDLVTRVIGEEFLEGDF